MKEKLLVINDDTNVRDIICMFLKSKSFDVFDACDGYQGIEQAILHSPDLILLDVMMPEIDGYATCVQLKKNSKTKDIPVIFLSSLSDPKDKIKGLESGGVDFVTRVEDRGELLARVETHLKISSLNREIKQRNAELIDKQIQLDKDLEMAAAIQRSLLPGLKFESPHVNVAWKCLPCEQIGGDIFNIAPINDCYTSFYILDVSGHGVASAMVTVAISQFMHQFVYNPTDSFAKNIMNLPRMVIENLNKEFPYERFNEFFTIFYMILNTQTGEVSYCNGGHPPSVLLHENKPLETMNGKNMAIGLTDGSYSTESIQLSKNDKIILYTDGIIECPNREGEFYSQNRFHEFLEGIKQQSPQNIVDSICKDLTVFAGGSPQLDDISVMVIEWTT